MSHFQRFLLTDARPLDLPALERVFQGLDPAWTLARREDRRGEIGVLARAGESFGEVEINRPGEELFREEIEELIEITEWTPGPKQAAVLERLRKAKVLVVLDVRWGDREREETRAALAPLWKALLATRDGLTHEDGVGFGDATGVLLEIR